MRELPRDLVTILRTEAKNQRTPPIDYVIAEDGGRMVHTPEPDIAMAELLEEAATALAANEAELAEALTEIERLKNLVGDPEGTAAHAEAFLSRSERAEAHLAEARKALEPAVADVLAERHRQVSAEGWSLEHDDAHDRGEMARAAGIYAVIAGSDPSNYRNARDGYTLGDVYQALLDHCWQWSRAWFKPSSRRRDLVKAGALIIAEIERLDRAARRALEAQGDENG